ncbi:MAG: hypothetical protein GEU93_07995 [Propionibacteriales bacterium]|nr:hypothetical protein [Propionibacteriales bacterium]
MFLCGDVMLGRGVDQILPHAGDPALREAYVGDAGGYVALAERRGGPIPRPVDFSWPWGDSLDVLDEVAPDLRIVNLETSVTRSDDFVPGKAVHYRMHPENLPCLSAVRPDACALANNHVLDFGRRGLQETLDALTDAGLQAAGAGRDLASAQRPAVVTMGEGRRVLVFSVGTESGGIPSGWAATEGRHGVALVPGLSASSAAEITDRVRRLRRPGDLVVVSIHWGSNWGYDVPRHQIRFAHRLIDGGVDAVHGHSSHHPRPIEVYKDRPILYGCGDFIDDYEGITGYEEYRVDLRLLYFVQMEAETGKLAGLRMVPMQTRQMRLRHAVPEDTQWLRDVLSRESRRFGSRVDLDRDGVLTLARREER